MPQPPTAPGTRSVPRIGAPNGTYPRILGKYVRGEGILPLEQAIMKMTFLPARRVGVTDRGTVAAGQFADITVFDPKTIAETATPENPAVRSTGVAYGVVNGRLAFDRSGAAVLRTSCRQVCGSCLESLRLHH